ncbi:HAMP domain-containing protein [Streptomyces sp. NPDC004589]|uniref:sensor histidine kinase n=1 Tax=Streptomyces sp. NPDC004589 TaxID=3154553 RepID=UPI0033BCCDA5
MIVVSTLLMLLIGSAFAVLFRSVADLRATQRLAQQSQGLLMAVNQVQRQFFNLETDARGYALTGQPQYNTRWQVAQAAFPKEAVALTRLAGSNAEQRSTAERIQQTGMAYIKEHPISSGSAAKYDSPTKQRTTTSERDDWRAEPIRDAFHRIMATEQSLATAREERAEATANRAIAATVGGLTGSVLLITAFAGYILRAIVHPVRQTAAMADRLANGDLKARTPETGAGEVGVLERSFNRMADSLQESHAELSTSRSRILAAADQARRRIEHDLHDGAQQQLVALVLELKTAQSVIPTAQPELKAKMSRAAERLVGVLDDLRELSHGIHPAVLSKGGLPPALRALARRSPVPVELDVQVPQRLPERIEVAAYYVASEALANTAKHAQASYARVSARADDDVLYLSVHDDGVGGAALGRGSGLVGLTDRIRALGGTLTLRSPERQGTTVQACLPLTEA